MFFIPCSPADSWLIFIFNYKVTWQTAWRENHDFFPDTFAVWKLLTSVFFLFFILQDKVGRFSKINISFKREYCKFRGIKVFLFLFFIFYAIHLPSIRLNHSIHLYICESLWLFPPGGAAARHNNLKQIFYPPQDALVYCSRFITLIFTVQHQSKWNNKKCWTYLEDLCVNC